MTDGRLSGSTALVTGAGSGLGRQIAFVLADAGASVAAVGRREAPLRETVDRIESAGGVGSVFVHDIAETGRVGSLFDQVETELGLVRVLVNNAALSDGQYATRLAPETVDRVIDTNLKAPFMLSCEFGRRLIDQSASGHIVNISSMLSQQYSPTSAASLYSVTKSGLNRMTETLAVEWSKFGINVNAIIAGAFDSEMMDGMLDRVGVSTLSSKFPRQRMLQLRHFDSTLLYLVAPESEAVTGAVIVVDDGQYPR